MYLSKEKKRKRKQIYLCISDLDRTFPDNIYFQNIPSDPKALRPPLFRVLVALGHHNPRVGYCQVGNTVYWTVWNTKK